MKKPAVDWDGKKKINLALQGGGAHGAFSWGVVDYILEDNRLDIEAISGTSAGAMNAVVYAEGYLEGGRAGARKSLESFWKAVSDEGALSPEQSKVFDSFFKPFGFDKSPAYWWMDFVTHYASPYEFNPLDINPLRDLLRKAVDFQKVRACEHLKIFISATNVHTGKIAVFERKDLTADHVMASACLPMVFQAVEIDGVPYWDGGYMGNPALFPLFYETACPDALIVQINPVERNETPKTAQEIQNRLNEITFNGALLRELRAVDFVQTLVDQGKLGPPDYVRPFIHRIDGAAPLAAFTAATKMDASWDMLTALRDIGRTAAKAWIDTHYDDIGVRNTLDLRAAFS
jgi:NTE family protein